jgi:cysteinyl-tRNA synthetase
MVLSKHFRTEGNFTWEILEASQNRLQNWQAAADLRWQRTASTNNLDILKSLRDDLNTPKALAGIDNYFETVSSKHKSPAIEALESIRDLLGIDLLKDDISKEQKQLIADRQKARDNNDFNESDRIRDELKKQKLAIRDTNNGQIWSRS